MSASTSGGAHPPDYRGDNPSDYRGINKSQELSKNTDNATTETEQTRNYAAVTKNEGMPKREHAVVINAISGYTVRDYVKEIVKITDPLNIRFISRISNGRICIYLPSKKIADDLIVNSNKIKLNENQIIINPLVTRAKRVILSNVYPEITNELIENKLKQLNLRLESKVTFIKAGMGDLGLLNACSFRRQVYIHPDDINEIPSSIKITNDSASYRIFLSTEGLTCFMCKEEGHLAKYCPKVNSQIDTELLTNSDSNIAQEVRDNTNQIESNEHDDQIITNIITDDSNTANINKRPLSVSSQSHTQAHSIETQYESDSSCYSLTQIDELSQTDDEEKSDDQRALFKTPKPKAKKFKTDRYNKRATKNFYEDLQPVKTYIDENQERFPLEYNGFTKFLKTVYASPITVNIIKRHTSNYAAVANMMREIYPLLLNDRSTKSLFTKVIKKLESIEQTK